MPAAPVLRAWAVTVAATVGSAVALDAVATAAGIALVASGALRHVGQPALLALLALSYAAWGAGLRCSVCANWALLERTATSTNAVSKAAHAAARRAGAGPRARRAAAGAGYVATELAKEAPYYAGAFGAAVASDSVSASQALVFLAGTNLGAAAYEYGLARATAGFLGRGWDRTAS